MPPLPAMPVPVTPVMVAVLPLEAFSVPLVVTADLFTLVVMVPGIPDTGMSADGGIVCKAMKFTVLQDNRVCAVSQDAGITTEQQACGEQGRLKQDTGFHGCDSFSGYLKTE
jgi:hypothetical protein